MNRVRSVAAGLLLIGVIGLVPVALLRWGVPATVLGDLARPDDGSALLAVLTVVGWLAWAAFAGSVAVEAVNLLGRRVVPLRIPLLGGLQSLAGTLLFAALSSVVLPAEAAPATAPPAPGSAAAASVAEATASETASDAAEPDDGGYRVLPGDDLWSISEQLLGDGRHWRTLAEANPGLLADPTADLVAGTHLRVPGVPDERPEPHRAPDPGKPGKRTESPRSVTVVRGDTLSGLAQQHLGRAALWPRIHAANADRIADPNLIDVGWKLVIPERRAAKPAPEKARPVRKPVPPTGQLPETDRPRVEQPATPAPQPADPPASRPDQAHPAPAEADQPGTAGTTEPGWPLIGPLSGVTAAMILAGLGANRLVQLRTRPVGRRIGHPPVDLRRYETALGKRERPEVTGLLERAQRALGAHAHTTGRPLPRLDRVEVDDVSVGFVWADPPGTRPPKGFAALGNTWTLPRTAAEGLPDSSHPVPFPALVTLGRLPDDTWLMIDLESRSPLFLDGSRAHRHGVMAALAVELSGSPWAAEVALTVVGGDEMFVRAACPELVRFHAEAGPAVAAVRALVDERGDDPTPTVLLRVDPETSEAGAVQVTLVADEPSPADRRTLAGLFEDRDLGVCGVLAGTGPDALRLGGSEADPTATLEPDGIELRPQLIAAHTRAAIGTIFAATDEAAHTEAPWWSADDNVHPLAPRRESIELTEREPEEPPAHPYLRLMGPVELLGARGEPPTRSRRQCEEYCAWLLEHPRSNASRMATQLVVAESTRRSNMSRLRSWLGTDPEGRAYLPEAYSGLIELHPDVGSDWQRMQVLAGPGLNRAAPETLVRILELVRGAPLADAAPGQWHWAEELRTDMASLARDAAVVLARWAIRQRDVDLARWAAARGLLAMPEDELLLVERVNTEALTGNTDEVKRLVRWLTDQSRVLGIDLAPETVDACQRALEGRTRARSVRTLSSRP